jgi:hypothetical protein
VWTVQDDPHEVRERDVAGLLRDGGLGQLDLLAGRGHLGKDGLAGRGAGVLDGDFADGVETVPDGEGVLQGGEGKAAEDGNEVVELGGYAADDHGDFAVLDKSRLLLSPKRIKVLAEAKLAGYVVCRQGPPFQDVCRASQRISADLGDGCSDSCFDRLLPLKIVDLENCEKSRQRTPWGLVSSMENIPPAISSVKKGASFMYQSPFGNPSSML